MPPFLDPSIFDTSRANLAERGGGGLPWQLVFTCPQKEFTCRLPRCQEGTLPTTDFKEELAGFSTDEYLASELYHKSGKVVIYEGLTDF